MRENIAYICTGRRAKDKLTATPRPPGVRVILVFCRSIITHHSNIPLFAMKHMTVKGCKFIALLGFPESMPHSSTSCFVSAELRAETNTPLRILQHNLHCTKPSYNKETGKQPAAERSAMHGFSRGCQGLFGSDSWPLKIEPAPATLRDQYVHHRPRSSRTCTG